MNIGVYVPLGFAAHLAFRDARLPYFRLYGPVMLAVLLSTSVEMAQR